MPLVLNREQILAHRLRATGLDRRRALTPATLADAAAPGLTDSTPRAALHSLHARLTGVGPAAWEAPPLVQVWGPRYSAYVVTAADVPVFTLGRLPDDPAAHRRATSIADRLADVIGDQALDVRDAARPLGIHPSALRYAAPTGRFLIRWDGAHRPTVRQVPAPDMDPHVARLELARRHLHLGPATSGSFGAWAGLRPPTARAAFAALAAETLAVTTPLGDAWILAADEATIRRPDAAPSPDAAASPGHTASGPASPGPTASAPAVRLLPSGDAHHLLQGADRALLVPDAARRAEVWTPRVWPGAVLVDGEIVGTWRRAEHAVTVTTWDAPTPAQRAAIEAEALTLPVPGLTRPVAVSWA